MKFIELRKEDVSEFKKLMQEAFQYGFESYTKQKEEQVLPEKDIDECLNKANMKLEDIDAFACTYGPGLLGSLLVGVEATKVLSFVYNKPLIAVNHMMGHICANMIGNNLEFPLISLIIKELFKTYSVLGKIEIPTFLPARAAASR